MKGEYESGEANDSVGIKSENIDVMKDINKN